MSQGKKQEAPNSSHDALSSRNIFMPNPIKTPTSPYIDEFRDIDIHRVFSLGEPTLFEGQHISLRIAPVRVEDKTNVNIGIKRKDGQTAALQGLPIVIHHEYPEIQHSNRMHHGEIPQENYWASNRGLGAFYYGTLDGNGEIVLKGVTDIPETKYIMEVLENVPDRAVDSVQAGGLISMPPVTGELIGLDAGYVDRDFGQTYLLADGSLKTILWTPPSGDLIADLETSGDWEGKIVPFTVTRRYTNREDETHRYFVVPRYDPEFNLNIASIRLPRIYKAEVTMGLPVKPMDVDEFTEEDASALNESVKRLATSFSRDSWQKFLQDNPGLPKSFHAAIQEGLTGFN